MSARIPSGDWAVSPPARVTEYCFASFKQAGDEVVDPALREVGGKGERKKCGVGRAAHGGDVAESAGEAAVADGVGGMPFATEVDAFEGEVGGDEGLGSAGEIEDGAVVSDADGVFAQASAETTGANPSTSSGQALGGAAARRMRWIRSSSLRGMGMTNIYSHRRGLHHGRHGTHGKKTSERQKQNPPQRHRGTGKLEKKGKGSRAIDTWKMPLWW